MLYVRIQETTIGFVTLLYVGTAPNTKASERSEVEGG